MSTRLLSIAAAVALAAVAQTAVAESAAIAPAMLGAPFPQIALPIAQGGAFSLAQLRGRNVLLVFPRGRAGVDHWCQICHYQYAELADLEAAQHFREKYNLEVVFVLPYDRALVDEWIAKFPSQMAVIEGWKNPADPEKLDAKGRHWMEMTRRLFPKRFSSKPGAIPIVFPVLIDADRTVSKGLGLFTTDWDHAKVEQNIPAIYLVDASGALQFKFVSQNTVDRPSPDYLFKVIERMVLKP